MAEIYKNYVKPSLVRLGIPAVDIPMEFYKEYAKSLESQDFRLLDPLVTNKEQRDTIRQFFEAASMVSDSGSKLIDYALWLEMWGGDPFLDPYYTITYERRELINAGHISLRSYWDVNSTVQDPQKRYRGGRQGLHRTFKEYMQEGYVEDVLKIMFEVPGTHVTGPP